MQPNLKIADWGQQQQQSDYFWLKGNQRNLLPVNLILHCQFKLSTCELGMVLPLTTPELHWLDCWSLGIEKPLSHQSRFEGWHKLKGKGPVHPAYNSSFSVCFFSRNNIFSHNKSAKSVFQPAAQPNGAKIRWTSPPPSGLTLFSLALCAWRFCVWTP
jgi:hypothetical protein